jgi:hypothetical protein
MRSEILERFNQFGENLGTDPELFWRILENHNNNLEDLINLE